MGEPGRVLGATKGVRGLQGDDGEPGYAGVEGRAGDPGVLPSPSFISLSLAVFPNHSLISLELSHYFLLYLPSLLLR